jgi:uncharacterized lipoprotein NlpE involved in copper resistance
MKTANWMMMFLLAGVLALVGCGKAKEEPRTMVAEGVQVDVPKLEAAFATVGPELQKNVGEVRVALRYADYPTVLSALDKLANAPSLTEPQKKILSVVTDQVKQVASKAAVPPAR